MDANAVGEVVTYVAPGFLAIAGYRTRYPRPPRPPGEVVIVSVVLSLPLVTVVQAILAGRQDPTQIGYIALLLATAAGAGYLAAHFRGTPRGKKALATLGYRLQPEGTMYSQLFGRMAEDATVVVELLDGRRVWGCPRSGPESPDDGINELYFTYPKVPDSAGNWNTAGGGIVVPIAQINTITFTDDPTRDD